MEGQLLARFSPQAPRPRRARPGSSVPQPGSCVLQHLLSADHEMCVPLCPPHWGLLRALGAVGWGSTMPTEHRGLRPLSVPSPAAALTLPPSKQGPPLPAPQPSSASPCDSDRAGCSPPSSGLGMGQRMGWGVNGRAGVYPGDEGGLPGGGGIRARFCRMSRSLPRGWGNTE